MVYTLDDADKLCGIDYIDWSKKYSPIPKATCEMIQPKCSSGGGSYTDDAVELKCEDLKKLIHGEEKPKEEKEEPKEDTPREETPSDNVGGNPAEDKPTTEDVTPKENEPTPEPPVADTPTEGNASEHLGDTPTNGNTEVNLLELMPKVEDKFSEVMFREDGTVWAVTEQRPEQREAFERKVIETLKSKLPKGAVVEAVLGEPLFKKGDKYITGKSNYTLNVRVTLNGKVYEQEYNVPHVESPLVGVTDSI
jgi:hypothetical protein|nr:MAG TPA: hypothetical protein [Caudoviricetes sp.]